MRQNLGSTIVGQTDLDSIRFKFGVVAVTGIGSAQRQLNPVYDKTGRTKSSRYAHASDAERCFERKRTIPHGLLHRCAVKVDCESNDKIRS